MENTRTDFLEKVLAGYAGSYDISREGLKNVPECVATAAFHLAESSYIISQKATMWQTKSDEYVYFFSMDQLTDKDCERLINTALSEGTQMIDLESENHHMCTRIVAVFIADRPEETAKARIKACKIYKNFKFGLKGWMEFHAVLVCPEEKTALANRYGRETANYFNRLMHPEKRPKKRRAWDIFRRMIG